MSDSNLEIRKYYENLVGKTVTAVVYDRETQTYGLKFGTMTAWIVCDEEGNGPGWLEVCK